VGLVAVLLALLILWAPVVVGIAEDALADQPMLDDGRLIPYVKPAPYRLRYVGRVSVA
jgi:hypothetical protein